MVFVRGCFLPEDIYYLIDRHVWALPMGGDLVRIGITSVAVHLCGKKLTGITLKTDSIGQVIKQGKSVAIIETSKYVGPVPATVTGILLRGNDALTDDPTLVIDDPYEAGWIAEIKATNWEAERASLATGPDGVAAYQAKLEAEGIWCS